MTEQNDNPSEETTDAVTELNMLKERAKMMGISLGGNIGIDTLKKKIDAKLNGTPETPTEPAPVATTPFIPTEASPAAVVAAPPRPKTKAEIEQALRTKLHREQMALVRCRIYNLNPSKRDLQGEIITVGNKYLGTVRKFIPFGEATDGGYHIPKVIYNDLKTRQFQSIRTRTIKGQIQVDCRMVPEYSIDVMPPLTRDELSELALKQAAAERLGSE